MPLIIGTATRCTHIPPGDDGELRQLCRDLLKVVASADFASPGVVGLFEPSGAPAGEALQGDQMWGDFLPVLEFIYIELASKWNLLLIKCSPR